LRHRSDHVCDDRGNLLPAHGSRRRGRRLAIGERRPSPGYEARKSVDGFGAWLLVTSGSESTQQGDSLQSLALASSRQVTSVMPGDVISLPIFLLNPTRDAQAEP
jgi:hypothetical protein